MSIIQGNAKQGSTRGFYSFPIEQSLRFNDNDSAYLSRTPASAGSARTATLSMWIKRGNITVGNEQWIWQVGTGNRSQLIFDTSDKLRLNVTQSGASKSIRTTQLFRDTSAWYHIVAVIDIDNATSIDRLRLYVNGDRITAFDSATYPTSGVDANNLNNTVIHNIGRLETGARYLDGYLAEVHFTDGTAYDADAFGELKSGVWVAKSPSVIYGTNGFYLDFATSGDGTTEDQSGEGNNWTENNFTASDVVLDSPTDNFATWNQLDTVSATFADGNLTMTTPTSGGGGTRATIGVSSGKWYWEITCDSISGASAGNQFSIGVSKTSAPITSYPSLASDSVFYFGTDGNKFIDGSGSSYGATFTTGDVIGVALNLDDEEITFYKNNVSQGVISTDLTGEWSPAYNDGSNGATTTITANFGQLGFTYTPPTGYLALSTANLPEPTISPADDASPEDYFNTVLWTGDGTSPRSITGVGFPPDWVWYKQRSASNSHLLFDSIRGASNLLKSNETGAEATNTNTLKSFDSDGFTVGSDGNTNGSGQTYVAWNWKANGSATLNEEGTIDSQVSANTTSGFSIVSYTGTGANATVGHGLGVTPEMIIVKNRDSSTAWEVQHVALGAVANQDIQLEQTGAAGSGGVIRWNQLPTSSVFSVGTANNTNLSGDDLIAYCFHSVEGYSKAFSYTGNGSSDGVFVHLGFRPAFILIKRTDASSDWILQDDQRLGYNVDNNDLIPNQSYAEQTDDRLDQLSNGFKLRSTFATSNASGGTYIGIAFAENPFKYSTAR